MDIDEGKPISELPGGEHTSPTADDMFPVSSGGTTYYVKWSTLLAELTGSHYVGTTEIANDRASGALALTGINSIGFPATAVTSADANTLDEYEEGTFTLYLYDAVIAGNQGSASATFGYIKIGRVVIISGNFPNIDTTGLTAGNPAFFGDFPFTSLYDAVGAVTTDNVTFGGDYLTFKLGDAKTRGALSIVSTGAVDGSVIVSQISDGVSDIFFTLTYIV